MTVIAYRNGVLAADTLTLSGWDRAGEVMKICKAGRILAGASGGTAICKRFLDWVASGASGYPDLGEEVDGKDWRQATGYLFLPDGRLVRFSPGLPPTVERADFYAFGSGGYLATGALAHGASAEEAVSLAIMHNAGCGGRVVSLRHD